MVAEPVTPDLAAVIRRGLVGHLHGFLPGNDNKTAIARAVSSMLAWCSRGEYGDVTRRGIGVWVYYAHKSRRVPADAVLFVTWREVLAVIEAGCADGYRERYEQAYAQYVADNRAADEEWKAGRPAARRRPVSDAGIYDATTALIRHGLDVQADKEPLTLF